MSDNKAKRVSTFAGYKLKEEGIGDEDKEMWSEIKEVADSNKELRTRVAELSKDAMFRRINMQVEQIEELQNRLSEAEDLNEMFRKTYVQPDCQVKRMREQIQFIEQRLISKDEDCKLWMDKYTTLLKASEGMEKALEINLPMLRAFHLDYTGGPTDENGNRPDQPIYKHENCGTCDDLIYGERILADFRAVKEIK